MRKDVILACWCYHPQEWELCLISSQVTSCSGSLPDQRLEESPPQLLMKPYVEGQHRRQIEGEQLWLKAR